MATKKPKPPADPSVPPARNGARKQPGRGGDRAKSGKGSGRSYGFVLPAEMEAGDRDAVVAHIRRLRRICAGLTERMLKRMEGEDVDGNAGWDSQALLNIEKAITEILGSHPGLLELAKSGDGAETESEAQLLDQALTAAGASDADPGDKR